MTGATQPVRLVYCGCGLAGKTTSLMSALTRCGQVLPEPLSQFALREHRFDVKRSVGENIDLHVRISERRAIRSYDPTDEAVDSVVVEEIDAISRAGAVVFVVDSHPERSEANITAFANLIRDLKFRGREPDTVPVVFQANKRDLGHVVTMDWVREHFRVERCAYIESVATQQNGTLEAMREAVRLVGSQAPFR